MVNRRLIGQSPLRLRALRGRCLRAVFGTVDADEHRFYLCGERTAHGAIGTGASVQRDGRTITASGPQAADEFAQAILAALEEP